jgi:hypothetical protein
VLLLTEGAHYYCCYWCCWRELCVSYNQPSWDKRTRDTREQVSKLLSFSHSFSLFKLSGVKKKVKSKTLQRSVGWSCNTLLDIAAPLRGLLHCRPSQHRYEVQHVAAATPHYRPSQQRCKVQRVVIAASRCWPSQQRYKV